MKIINSFWFTGLKTIGIITGEDEVTGKRKAYIGVGAGFDEKSDAHEITCYGSPFSLEVAELILKDLKEVEKTKQKNVKVSFNPEAHDKQNEFGLTSNYKFTTPKVG